MIKLSDYQTQDALPAGMKTAERIALSYAFDNQKKKYIDRLRHAYIWADLDEVDDDKLDLLAAENRVLFYNTELAPDIKRQMIRNSIYWYMKLGTRQVMEEMIDTVFDSTETSVEEWQEYGGEPFHFRVATGVKVTQDSIYEFLQYLNRIKNARSRFDCLVFQEPGSLIMENRTELFYISCEPCAEECLCGTMPDCDL